MSTKIYNAFRIKADSLDEAYQFLKNVSKPIVQSTEKAIAAKNLEEAIDTYFELIQGNKDFYDSDSQKNIAFSDYLNRTPLSLFRSMELDRNSKDKKTKLEENHDASAVLYSEKVGNKTYYLCQFFGSSEALNIFKKHPQLTDFNYWNNTDKEDNVSAKDWNTRKRVWDKIFKESSVPNETGLVLTYVDARRLFLGMLFKDAESTPFKYSDEEILSHVSKRQKTLGEIIFANLVNFEYPMHKIDLSYIIALQKYYCDGTKREKIKEIPDDFLKEQHQKATQMVDDIISKFNRKHLETPIGELMTLGEKNLLTKNNLNLSKTKKL